jgi:hypothetical protein
MPPPVVSGGTPSQPPPPTGDHSAPEEPWYKGNLFWGSIGALFAFVLPVVGMLKDIRLLVWGGFPFACIALWTALARARSSRLPATLVGSVILAVLTWFLYSSLEPRPAVSPVFKPASAFTYARRAAITKEMNSMYDYMIAAGFTPPKELPPLAVRRKGEPISVVINPYGGGSSIDLIEETLDDPQYIRTEYAEFAVCSIIVCQIKGVVQNAGTEFALMSRRGDASRILAKYLVADYAGTLTMEPENVDYKWVHALWDMRTLMATETEGRRFVTDLIVNTCRYFNEINSDWMIDFDVYFSRRLTSGAIAADNHVDHLKQVKQIFVVNGISLGEVP